MANTKSATKRARQSMARSLHNRSVRTRLRTLQRRMRVAGKPAAEELRALISAIDKAAKRGIIHRNAANRRKARLQRMAAAAMAQK
jgi:small subunit ribosomal protein S20